MSCKTAFQINMHPNDVRYVGQFLPHQIRVWGKQVDRVFVALDLHRSRAGRYRNEQYDDNLRKIRALLSDDIPDKAWDGGPFYSYFFGMWAASAKYVVHTDSDMFFGGGDRSWLADVIHLLESRSDLLFVAPLSGPPRADGQLIGQAGWERGAVQRDSSVPVGYLFPTVSTRIFVTGQPLLRERIGALDLIAPTSLQKLRSHILGNPPIAIEAERLLSQCMAARDLRRMDFLGNGSGMWTLHPPYRSEMFFSRLPQLIEQIESGQVPAEQRGRYDVHDSLIDWSEQRRLNTPRHRWQRHMKQLVARMAGQ